VDRFSFPAFALTLLLGLLTGSVITAWVQPDPVTLEVVDDPGSDVAVIHIEGIRDSALIGTASGEVRLFAGDEAVPITASGTFAIRDAAMLTNIIMIRPPEGMNFVASKRGKKYYPLTSGEGQRIVPENRVYFPTAESARKAGYAP